MATLHMMCGLPGAGKTTLARRLEREHRALRLTPDEWVTPLYGPELSQEALDAVRTHADLPPHTFEVTPAQLDLWWSLFEPPATDELVPRRPA